MNRDYFSSCAQLGIEFRKGTGNRSIGGAAQVKWCRGSRTYPGHSLGGRNSHSRVGSQDAFIQNSAPVDSPGHLLHSVLPHGQGIKDKIAGSLNVIHHAELVTGPT